MKSCTQAKFETAFVRFLAAAVVGALVYIGAEPAAQYFHIDLPNTARLLGAGAFALVGWFVTKNLVDFTTDCLDVPAAVAPAITGRKQEQRPTTKRLPQLTVPVPVGIAAISQTPIVIKSNRLTVTVTKNDDTSLSVVAVAIGVSNSEYKGNNGIRASLENVKEIAWSNPTRDTAGGRRMEGRASAGANHQQVIARLNAVVERKGA